jgi:hypothetical protein
MLLGLAMQLAYPVAVLLVLQSDTVQRYRDARGVRYHIFPPQWVGNFENWLRRCGSALLAGARWLQPSRWSRAAATVVMGLAWFAVGCNIWLVYTSRESMELRASIQSRALAIIISLGFLGWVLRDRADRQRGGGSAK